jgi:hypothetical protein
MSSLNLIIKTEITPPDPFLIEEGGAAKARVLI